MLSDGRDCGIPIKKWLILHFLIQMARTGTHMVIAKLDEIPIVRQSRTMRKVLKGALLLTVEFAFCGWLVYGNVLYFSPSNQCAT